MAQDGIIERLLGASAGSARMFAALAGDVASSLDLRGGENGDGARDPLDAWDADYVRKRALPKIDLRKRLGPNPDVDEAYELVTSTMQRALDRPDAERRLPVVG